jgi:hypothetical protein
MKRKRSNRDSTSRGTGSSNPSPSSGESYKLDHPDGMQRDRLAQLGADRSLACRGASQIGKKRAAPPTDPMETAPGEPFDLERLAA